MKSTITELHAGREPHPRLAGRYAAWSLCSERPRSRRELAAWGIADTDVDQMIRDGVLVPARGYDADCALCWHGLAHRAGVHDEELAAGRARSPAEQHVRLVEIAEEIAATAGPDSSSAR